MVSTFSNWDDDTWQFASPTDGQKASATRMSWDFDVKGGGRFSAAQWNTLRLCMKLQLWWLIADPLTGRNLKVTSISTFAVALRSLVNWMAARKMHCISQLTPEECADYAQDIADATNGRSEKQGAVYGKLRLLEWLFLHTPHFKQAQLPHLPRQPFSNSANWLARRLTDNIEAQTPPITDEVAIPLLNAAVRLLGQPADDLINLLRQLYEADDHPTLTGLKLTAAQRRSAARRAVAAEFQFSIIPGEAKAWHPPIRNVAGTWLHHISVDGVPTTNYAVYNLVRLVIEAASITIQSNTGIRPNELCGLESGPISDDGLPRCITKKLSNSGLSEIFYLKGWVAKSKPGKEPSEWVIGLRPLGSAYIPHGVRAVIVLEQLLEPWRVRHRNLFLFPRNKGFLHNPEHLKPPTTDQLRVALDHFSDHVFGKGKHRLLPRQWRPTFAQFVFKVNPTMLPEIFWQFKHMSLAVTEQSYLQNDAAQLETLDQYRISETVRYLLEASSGKQPSIGGGAALLKEQRENLRALSRSKSRSGRIRKLTAWVITHDLRLWFLDEGKCLVKFRPSEAQCHTRGGTRHWANDQPNYLSRTPDVCLSCRCFAIDHEHAWFWRKRLDDNKAAYAAAKEIGQEAEFSVAAARAKQAAAVLAALER